MQRCLAANFDEELRTPGGKDHPREESACVVCARRFWKHQLRLLRLFQDPDLEQLPDNVSGPVVPKSEQQRLCRLLSVDTYLSRWPQLQASAAAKAELMASSVPHPYIAGEHLLVDTCCCIVPGCPLPRRTLAASASSARPA